MSRFFAFALVVVFTISCAGLAAAVDHRFAWPLAVLGPLTLLGVWHLVQPGHSLMRNYPLMAHFRWLFEMIRPEIRQYLIESDHDAAPFDRTQRSLVYQRAKGALDNLPFGTRLDTGRQGYAWIAHSIRPADVAHELHRVEVGGEACAAPYSASLLNISAMSFGSLSARAIEALNRGAAAAGCLHNTGEGGISSYHLKGGELIWQLGTGYFGARDADGSFSKQRFLAEIERRPSVRAVEIKLSQGAKPGLGGVLPAAKVTPEIARIRGIPMGRDCISPSVHSAFTDVDSLLDFVEDLADASGLPVGIKSAVGEDRFWRELAEQMATTGRAVDFVSVDGGEGGTGAAPLVFADHVSLPFKVGMSRVYRVFCEHDLQDDVVFIGSGRLGLPDHALFAFALGCDLLALAREPMLAVGCIQAQRCHTGHCPTGVATQNRWLARGLDPELKAERLTNYIKTLRKEILRLSRACGAPHPALVTLEQFDIVDDRLRAAPAGERFGYQPEWCRADDEQRDAIAAMMAELVGPEAGTRSPARRPL